MSKYFVAIHAKAKDFIESLDKARKARVDRYCYLFEEYGTLLSSKYLKKIAKNVWELRPGDIRLFLTLKGNRGYIIHGIYKKTQKTPKRDLDVVIKRIKEEAE
ncbi:MAG: type II toxin-antitoxin system RelE/ParE family toxin [Patescibacteria group bacterium]